jgi:hypothetical protein
MNADIKKLTADTIMVEVATASLIGKALNYAVATVEGWEFAIEHRFNDGGHNHRPGDYWSWWRREEQLVQFATFDYCTKWEKGGPLIEKYRISFVTIGTGPEDDEGNEPIVALTSALHYKACEGKTHLIAACRAIVATALGDTVSIPAELAEASV